MQLYLEYWGPVLGHSLQGAGACPEKDNEAGEGSKEQDL